MRNIFLGLTAVGFFILVISYLLFRTPSPAIEDNTASVQHVSLYHYFSGSLSGGVDETVDIINTNNDHAKIIANALDHEAFKSLIISNLAKGDPPELFTCWAGIKTQELVDRKYLEPLDDIWQSSEIGKRLSPSLTDTASVYNGQKYFLPLDQHIVVFFYNVSLFQNFGLNPPQNYAELVAAATTLKEGGITPFALGAVERWPAQFWFDYLLLRTAGPSFRESLMQGRTPYTAASVVNVYRQWSELILQGFFNSDANDIDWAAATRMVCSGQAAMTLMGTWAIQQFSDDPCNQREQTDFNFFPFPLINEDVAYTSVGPVDGIVVTRASANREEAKRLLSHFLDREPQQAFSKGSGAFATSEDVPESAYSPLKQHLLQLIKESESWAFNYDLATSQAIADFGMDSFNELLAFPGQYQEILVNLDEQIKNHTKTRP